MTEPSTSRWIRREPLVLPLWRDLPQDAREAFRRADDALDAAADRAALLPHAGLEGALPPPRAAKEHIHHRLTVKFPPVTTPIGLFRSREEWSVLNAQPGAADALSRQPLQEDLNAWNKRFTGDGLLRTGAICTNADSMGRRVVFPPPGNVRTQLEELHGFLARHDAAPRSFRGTVSLIAVTNCHPYTDGNGRVGRSLFNAIINSAKSSLGCYLPLREIHTYSRGGYIIRARQAEIHGDWTPISRFMLAAVRLWDEQLFSKLQLSLAG